MAKENTNICLMVGDLGYGAVEPFMNAYPERFINAGIAEQNMLAWRQAWQWPVNMYLCIQLLIFQPFDVLNR